MKTVLAPYLVEHDIIIDARCVETSRKGPLLFRGGLSNYLKAKNDIQAWLKQDPSSWVSTLFDYYGLPENFPEMAQAKKLSDVRQRIGLLEEALARVISHPRFIPHIQLHEFESLLFCGPEELASVLAPANYHNSLSQIVSILDSFYGDPEKINAHPSTAPSKRLETLFPRYDKVAYGPRIAQKIGIERLRSRCKHFGSWINSLKCLSGSEL